jgi:sulfofructose kinase
MVEILTVGIAVLDDIFRIPDRLIAGAKHRASGVQTVFGGCAANAAFAIARLGGHARLLTRIGGDGAGVTLRAMLEGGGIDTSLSQTITACKTSRSAIVVEADGERTIINHLDPTLPDLPDWLPQALPAGCRAVLTDIRWEPAALKMLSLARKAGLPAVLDGDRAPSDLTLIETASHAVFSAQGLRELTKIEDLRQALTAIGKFPDQFLAVTDGARGVHTLSQGKAGHAPAFEVQQVDALGAGDVWHGAFTLALAEAQPLDEALRFASAASAIKVTRAGGATGAPKRQEIMTFLGDRT